MDPLSRYSIKHCDPGDPAVRPLVEAHLSHSQAATPQTSNHTMDVQALRAPDIRFWALSDESGAVGCGALKTLPNAAAEVKSVHIARAARGRGLGRVIMMYLIKAARLEGTKALVLETGTMEEYNAARGLYEALGFTYCGPIPGYDPDPNSAFMRLGLDPIGKTRKKGRSGPVAQLDRAPDFFLPGSPVSRIEINSLPIAYCAHTG